MTSKHTPEPWRLADHGEIVGATRRIAYMQPFGANQTLGREGIANARLISAAPELLEACRMILASAPDTRKGFPHWNYEEAGERDYALALKAAYAAIRKATGTDGASNTSIR